MQQAQFIAGDWGTSNLRLYLCTIEDGHSLTLLDTRFGPGISEANSDFSEVFFNLAQDWIDQHGAIPVILSGMVGSNIGWKEAPYLTCPVKAEEIAAGRVSFEAGGLEFSILAGLRTTNPLGLPDVMRGEELQVLGWLQNHDHHAQAQRLFALPGTHNKWALIKDGELRTFITAFTGELFALLRNNSILIADNSDPTFSKNAFMQGVRTIETLGKAHLLHSLFSVRSHQVIGEMSAADSLSYLSGLITAADVFGAVELFKEVNHITVIGEPRLAMHYKLVLEHLGQDATCSDPEHIAVAGYAAIYRVLYHQPENS